MLRCLYCCGHDSLLLRSEPMVIRSCTPLGCTKAAKPKSSTRPRQGSRGTCAPDEPAGTAARALMHALRADELGQPSGMFSNATRLR